MNIRDIAQLAGVSVTTVSRCLNEPDKLRPETYTAVMEVIAQYNYVPNNSARFLKALQSNIVCVVVKGASNPLFTDMISIIQRRCRRYGYSMLLKHIESDQDELDVAIEVAKEKKLLGIIFLGGSLINTGKKLLEVKVPMVIATSNVVLDVPAKLYSSVSIDDVTEAAKATGYLLGQGHRDICIIVSELMSLSSIMKQRLKGYRQALEAHGIPYREELVVEAPGFSEAGGYQAYFDMAARGVKPTAVFAIADTIAVGFCRAALVSGVRIPQDLSVMGFDGVPATEYYYPAITTVKQPTEEMAAAAIETLYDILQGGHNKHLTYEGTILVRESCAPPHTEDIHGGKLQNHRLLGSSEL